MKIHHWTYAGLAFILASLTLIGVEGTAALANLPHVPSQATMRLLRLSRPKSAASPIRQPAYEVSIRLFANRSLTNLRLGSGDVFIVGGKRIQGPISVSVKGKDLLLKGKGGYKKTVSSVNIHPTGDWIEIRTPKGIKRTRGEIKLWVSNSQLRVVNTLDMEAYLKGILEPELGSLKLRPAVLMAQLVAARSYVLSMRRQRHPRDGYEFCDTPHCQVFGGITERIPRFDQMAGAVKGEYLTYRNSPIPAFYHHNCGGTTSAVQDVWPAPARPFLKAVPEGDKSVCRVSLKSHWRFTASRSALSACFRRAGLLKKRETLTDVKVVKRDASGRAQQLALVGAQEKKLTVGRFRNVINQYYDLEVLRSAMFTVDVQGEQVIFEGRGWGHGVGFCQEGALHMARQGKTYKQILQHYFPNTKLARLPKA